MLKPVRILFLSQHWLWLLPSSSQRTQIGPAIMLKTFQVAGLNTDLQELRFEIPAIQLPSKVRKKLISVWFYFPLVFCIIGFLAATDACHRADMYGSHDTQIIPWQRTLHPLGRCSHQGLWPKAPWLWQKTDHPLQYLPVFVVCSLQTEAETEALCRGA